MSDCGGSVTFRPSVVYPTRPRWQSLSLRIPIVTDFMSDSERLKLRLLLLNDVYKFPTSTINYDKFS